MSKEQINAVRLQPNKLREVSRTAGQIIYQAIVPVGTKMEDVVKPEFYALVSSRFAVAGFLPEIIIVPEDVSWYFRGVITSYGTTHAVVKELFSKELEDAKVDVAPEEDSGYTVKYGGPSVKHRVIGPDGSVVAENMTKSEAHKFLEEHLKIIGS